MNYELTVEVKCFSLLCLCDYSYVFILILIGDLCDCLSAYRLQYLCMHLCVRVFLCNGRGLGGCSFILLIQGQFLIMQSEYMETLQEHMH